MLEVCGPFAGVVFRCHLLRAENDSTMPLFVWLCSESAAASRQGRADTLQVRPCKLDDDLPVIARSAQPCRLAAHEYWSCLIGRPKERPKAVLISTSRECSTKPAGCQAGASVENRDVFVKPPGMGSRRLAQAWQRVGALLRTSTESFTKPSTGFEAPGSAFTRFGSTSRLSLRRVVRPVMFGVAAFHVLFDLGITACPEASQILSHLQRALRWGQQV